MRFFFLFTALFTGNCRGPVSAGIPYTATPSATATHGFSIIDGNLENQIARLEENMPRAHSELYVIPTEAERSAFADMVLAIENGNVEILTDQSTIHNYELIQYTDHGDHDAISYVLREQSTNQKGWGLYIFRKAVQNNIIVEAPHPLADEHTPRIALDIYRALNARALLIAGAHRDANKNGSADSAHAAESIFQSVHLTLFRDSENSTDPPVFLQIHGFAADNHLEYPQIVLGYSWTNDPEKDFLLQNIVDALKHNNIGVGVCNGKIYQDLCGKKNAQSSATRRGIFIHIELNEAIREHDDALVVALEQVLGQ